MQLFHSSQKGKKGNSFKASLIITALLLLCAPVNLISHSMGNTLEFPLIANGEYIGYVPVSLDDMADYRFFGEALRNLLEVRYNEEHNAAILKLGEWPAVSELNKAGIEIGVNYSTLEVELTIYPEQKPLQSISVARSSSGSTVNTDLLDPEFFSFYVNYTANYNVDFSETITDPFRKAEISLLATPSLQLGGWVLDSRLTVESGPESNVTVNSLFLTKDLPGRGLRIRGGDISYSPLRLLSSSSAFGLMVTNQVNFTPGTRSYSSFTPELFLEEDASVEILVNGNRQRSYRLASGPYQFTDLYLNAGINEVIFKVTPEIGAPYEEFSLASYDTKLLKQGESSFFYGAAYDDSDSITGIPALFGSHWYGLSSLVTSGLGFQIDEVQQNVAVETLTASSLGTFGAGAALSRHPDTGFGTAFRFSYLYTRPEHPRLLLEGYFHSDRYTPFGSDTATSQPLYTISASTSTTVLSSLGISSTFRLSGERSTLEQELSSSLRLSGKISDSLSVSGSLSASAALSDLFTPEFGTGLTDSIQASIRFSYRPNRSSSVNLSTDIDTPSATLGYSVTPKALANKASFSLQGNSITPESPLPSTISLSGNYVGGRYQLRAGSTITPAEDETPTSVNTSISFSSAIAYAGGFFGLSQPIQDGFVIIAADKKSDGVVVGYRKNSSTVIASDPIFHTVVNTGITAYSANRVSVEMIKLPEGFNPGTGIATVKPGYRQGSVFTLSSEKFVYANGRLLFADSEPAGLVFGTILDETGIEEFSIFFTDEAGVFYLYDLTPGTYTLRVDGTDWEELQFTVPRDAEGEVDLGSLFLSLMSSQRYESTRIGDSFAQAEIFEEEVVSEEDVEPVPFFGRLINADESPEPFTEGRIMKTGDAGFTPVSIVTDQDGSFIVYNLESGEYQVEFYLDELVSFTYFIAPEESASIKSSEFVLSLQPIAQVSSLESSGEDLLLRRFTRLTDEDTSAADEGSEGEKIEKVSETMSEESTPVSSVLEELSDPTVEMEDFSSIKIVNPDGTPAEGVLGSLYNPASGQGVLFFEADAFGRIKLGALSSGRYTLRLFTETFPKLYVDIPEEYSVISGSEFDKSDDTM